MIDLSFLEEKLAGATVPRPNVSGTLSGHAAGEPFSDLVLDTLRLEYGDSIKKQHQMLNNLMRTKPDATKFDRLNLIPLFSLGDILWTGRINNPWNTNKLFQEKQSDFADILNMSEMWDLVHVIDVKTRNASKTAQPPNIMSALRLANLCKSMLDHDETDSLRISYVGVDWVDEGTVLRCVKIHITEMMSIPPELLYINFTAALQIQFHPSGAPQDFTGSNEDWCKGYLRHYTESYDKRTAKFGKTRVDPFRGYGEGE